MTWSFKGIAMDPIYMHSWHRHDRQVPLRTIASWLFLHIVFDHVQRRDPISNWGKNTSVTPKCGVKKTRGRLRISPRLWLAIDTLNFSPQCSASEPIKLLGRGFGTWLKYEGRLYHHGSTFTLWNLGYRVQILYRVKYVWWQANGKQLRTVWKTSF